MQKISLVNLIIGFSALFLAMCGGFFISYDAEKAFLYDKTLLASWQYTLLKSAHGHLTLFGVLHVLFGLTLPYSQLGLSSKKLQTLGLFLGSCAMGILMLIRAYYGPKAQFDFSAIFIGTFLSAATLSIAIHIYGLILKLRA
jgi:hypothetical protein